ncbi:MAG: BatD family protein [Pseudomonadales bacterium]|nr:BatD family protein [Pseudomonadales bacterium]HJN51449.1 BatD family protein [Pseudomonadales bacterium]
MRSLGSMLLFLSMWFTASCNADPIASVDSTEITEVDTLQLTLRWSGTESSAQPDFSPLLRDFEVLSTGRKSGMTFSSANGRRQSSSYVEWILSLRPMRIGRLTIPPIQHENLVSNAIVINVAKLSSNAKQEMSKMAFLITSVDKERVYVQSQLMYTVKFYFRNDYSGDLPSAPSLEDVLVKTLVEKNTYQTNVNDIRYSVAEWRYALFPQKSGELMLKREVLNGQIVVRGGSLFSRSRRENVRSVSEGHHITVKPKPAAFTAANWLPARSLTLTESWTDNPPVFTVGEPISRAITVVGEGVPVSLLEPLATEQMENAKVYSDPTQTDESFNERGLMATRIETVGIVPTVAAALHFPEIRVDWWNSERDRAEVARIPAASYRVLPATGAASIPFQPTAIEPPVPAQPAGEPETLTMSYWIYVAAALALAFVLTTTQWLRTRRELYQVKQQYQEGPLNGQPHDQSQADIYKEITRSCHGSDPLAARAALLRWAQMHWPDQRIQSTRDLRRAAVDDQLNQAITDLDQHLFSPDGQQSWDGEPLLDRVNQLKGNLPKQHKEPDPAIPSLYPT